MRCARRSSCARIQPCNTIADLKGKRVALGYSAMRNIDVATRAMLATAGLTEADVKVVLVPNVVRSADDFMAGNADMFYFAFGGPKVREADATVGGLRVLDMDEEWHARRPQDHGLAAYASPVAPGPIFIGVEKPMKVYAFDNVLITSIKVKDELIYQVLKGDGGNKGRHGRRAAGVCVSSRRHSVTRSTTCLTIRERRSSSKDRNLTPRPLD